MALHKAKNLMAVTERILAKKTQLTAEDDSWMERLWAWADENGIADLRGRGSYEYGLPRDKERLLNLTELILHTGPPAKLPVEIVNLTKLTHLGLGGGFEGVPVEISELPNLISLSVWEARGIDLKGINNLTNLKSLCLSSDYSELDLDTLNLSSFLKLRVFSVVASCTEFPVGICELVNLKDLDLPENDFGKLPSQVTNLTNLTRLNLSGNSLSFNSEQEDWLCNLVDLESLDLSGNNAMRLPVRIVELTNLLDLRLSDMILSSEQKKWVYELEHLKYLDLSGNKTGCFPKEVCNLKNLTTLWWGRNQLIKLPAEIGNLTNLANLDLGNNQLRELPAEIGNLTNLTWLELSNNSLTKLPAEIINLARLKSFDLYGNPEIKLTDKQKDWISDLKRNRCYVSGVDL